MQQLPCATNNILRPYHEWNDKFQREDERLKTFENWPLEWLDKNELAMTGMFYTGMEDRTKCYFCEVVLGRWEYEDKPVQEHMRWSPQCPLLNRQITNNIPINDETLMHILPKSGHDICGFQEFSHNVSFVINSCAYLRVDRENSLRPTYPEYGIETIRLSSFSGWSGNMKQNPQQLAAAGFFYSGLGDCVKCFNCGVGLKDWDDDVDPWEQHAFWMETCSFVKLRKGENYAETVSKKLLRSQSKEGANVDRVDSGQEWHKSNLEFDTAKKEESMLKFDMESNENASTSPKEKLCKICFVNEYNMAFIPCGHVVSCNKCAESIRDCPICRKQIERVARLYFS